MTREAAPPKPRAKFLNIVSKDTTMTAKGRSGLRIPLAILLGVLLQAAGAVWWASARDSEIRFQQARIDRLEGEMAQNMQVHMEILQRLARIEEKVGEGAALLQRIDHRLNEGRR